MRHIRLLMSVAAIAVAAGSAAASETVNFSYDQLGRVIGAAKSTGPNAGTSTTITFDRAHNRTVKAVGQGGNPPPGGGPVTLSVTGPAPVNEGATANFTVSLSGTPQSSVSVNYATSSGTATEGADYTPTSGALTFQSGQMSILVPIGTLDDAANEGVEAFSLTLSNPSFGATISQASASASIAASDQGNQPPVATADTLSVKVCNTQTVNLVANDTDPEGNVPLTLVSVTPATLGVVSISGTTSIVYQAGEVGTETLSYVVRDTLGATSTGQASVTVRPNLLCDGGGGGIEP